MRRAVVVSERDDREFHGRKTGRRTRPHFFSSMPLRSMIVG
jgi:hypothetical protein